MNPKTPRKTQLSAHTIDIVNKYLPENNSNQPDGFPISFSDFCALTNVREVAINAIKRSQKRSYKIYLENEDCIRAQEYNFYLKFYKSEEARNYSPCCDIIVNGNCSTEQCQLVMSYPNAKSYPVSFETFCKYTNYEEIVDKAVKALKLKIDRNSTEWQKYAHKLYRQFYTNEEKRKKFNIRIKPCTKSFKEQLLMYAQEAESFVSESPKRPQSLDTLQDMEQPLPKRPRIISENIDHTNFEEVNVNRFPVHYDTFLMHTNVKELAQRYLKNKSDPFSKSFDVVELTKKLYVEFYTKPRYENVLFNELFVRQNYAEIITSFPDPEMSTDMIATERNMQNEISGEWCIKIPNSKEFKQKYLNSQSNACTPNYNNNNNNSNCLSRNENVEQNQRVIIQSVEIIKPANASTHTLCLSGLNESERNDLNPPSVSLVETNENIYLDKNLPENYEPIESEKHDREQDYDVSNDQITEVTQNSEKTVQSESNEHPEDVECQETEATNSFESNDRLRNDVQNDHGQNDNNDNDESIIDQTLCRKELDQVIPNPEYILQHRDLIESDQVTQLEPPETTTEKGNEIVPSNETVQPLETSSSHIEMTETTDHTTSIIRKDTIHSDQEQTKFTNQTPQTSIVQEANKNLQLDTQDVPNQTHQILNIPEKQVSTSIVESTEAEHNNNVCKTADPADHKNIEILWHYPVSFTYFCKYAKLNEIIESIRKKRTKEKSIESSDTTWMNIAREVYENFFTDPEKRKEYAISFKPLPEIKKKKFFKFAFKMENKGKSETDSDHTVTESVSTAPLKSLAKQCENQKLPEKEKECVTEEVDTKDDVKSIVDSVELALKAIFDDKEIQAMELEVQEAPKNVLPENSVILMSSSNSAANTQVTSAELIDVHQKETNVIPSYMESPHRDFMRGFSQLRSESLLRPSNICDTSILEGTMTDNFIDMPNTQQQCESLSNNHTNIPNQSDPLNETIFQPALQENVNNRNSLLASVLVSDEAPSSTTENPADTDIKSKELLHKKVFPLKNLKFDLNDSNDDFEVKEFEEEPVLLNDSQDSTIFEFRTERDILRDLVNQLPSPSRNISTLQTNEGTEETFMCPEAQRLPSSISFEAQPAESTVSLSITTANSNTENVQQTNITENVSQPQKTTKENSNLQSGKQKKAHYRVVKSKNFAYEVPQILHALRPLPVAAISGQKQPNGTINTRSTTK